MNDLKVKLQVFEGPLDLLLHLVKINEMEIHEVRISEITAQYLAYLRLMESLDLEVAGEFLVMAATLLNIKLRALLPATGEEEESEEEIGDIMTAQALMERLIEYRKFKEAAAELRDQEQSQARTFFRDVALPRMAGLDQGQELNIDLEKLLAAFSRVLRFVDQDRWHMVTEEEFSVEEKMDEIEGWLEREKRVDVEQLFRQARSKIEMIVYLLAVLELCHMRRAGLQQGDSFGAIHLYEIGEEPEGAKGGVEELEPLPTPSPLPEDEDAGDEAEEDGAGATS